MSNIVGISTINHIDIASDLRSKLERYFDSYRCDYLSRKEMTKLGCEFIKVMYNHRDDVIIEESCVNIWYENYSVHYGDLYSFVLACGIYIPYYEWIYTERLDLCGEIFLYNKSFKTGRRTTKEEYEKTLQEEKAKEQAYKKELKRMRAELKAESKPTIQHTIPKGFFSSGKRNNFNVKFNNRGRR